MTPIDLGPLMYDRGRGPELRSKRLTVYNVWGELFHADITETELCRRYAISEHEVAALRAYALTHHAAVAKKIHEMDERTAREIEAQNTPEFLAELDESHRRFGLFKQFFEARKYDPELFVEIPGEPVDDRRFRLVEKFKQWATSRERASYAEVG